MSSQPLTPPMIQALHSHDEGRVYGAPATLRALHRRGLCDRPAVISSQGMVRRAGATLTEAGAGMVAALTPQGSWLVLKMDDGLLRRAPTRKAALSWWMSLHEHNRVIRRHKYGPGAYEYITAYEGDRHSSRGVYIEREDAARREGWNVDQKPLYPKANEPYARAERLSACF